MKSLQYLLIPLFILGFIRGCDFTPTTDHDYSLPETTQPGNDPVEELREITLVMDWSALQEPPTGMTVLFYPKQVRKEPYKFLTNNVDQITVQLPVDHYTALVFNQSAEEFASLEFSTDTLTTATVKLNENKPTRAYVCTERLRGGSLASSRKEIPDTRQPVVVSVVVEKMRPEIRIFDMDVTVHATGLENVLSVLGSLDGLANGFMLDTGDLCDDTYTQLITDWDINTGNTRASTSGTLTTTFGVFGYPHVVTDANGVLHPTEANLHLEFMLKNGRTVVFDKDVKDLVELHEDEGGSTVIEIKLEIGTNIENNPESPDVPPLDLATLPSSPTDPNNPSNPSDPNNPKPPTDPTSPTDTLPSTNGVGISVSPWGTATKIEIKL